MSRPYRTFFVGTLVQESFLSAGGSDDPDITVDSPFCRDGLGRPTLRGTGLAGALIATLRRLGTVPPFDLRQQGRTPALGVALFQQPSERHAEGGLPAARRD